MDKNLPIRELESFLNCTQFLIDDIMRERKANNEEIRDANMRLQKLSKYRNQITKLIYGKLDETFNQ